MTVIDPLNPVVYEFLNVFIASLCTVMVAIFARYLLYEFFSGHLDLTRWVSMRLPSLRHQMAISIVFWTLGEGLVRWWSWLARFAENVGEPQEWMVGGVWQYVPLFFALIQGVGLICAVRVFYPEEWGGWGWKFFVLAMILMISVIGTSRIALMLMEAL